MRRAISMAMPVGIAFAVLSCGKDNGAAPSPSVVSVEVTPGADTLGTLGRTLQLTAAAFDASHRPVTGVSATWRSNAPAVASVDSTTGLVTAVGNGAVTITAVVGGVTGQAALAVAQVVASVAVTPGSATVTTVGVTQPFGAVARDSNATAVAGVRFLWQSSDPGVATIDTNGVARSKGPGQTTITGAAGGGA